MPDGVLNDAMRDVLRGIFRNRVVTDFGAGDLALAREFLQLGAKSVVAVDKEPRGKSTKRIAVVRQYFYQFTKPIDVLVLSWPINHPCTGLIKAVGRADTVVYLGCNTDGNACGTPELFANLLVREVVAHVPSRRNTLIIYGPGREIRIPLYEEIAAIDQSAIYHYDMVYDGEHERC